MTQELALAVPEKWSQEVRKYEEQRFNVLAPRSIGALPAFHTPRLEVVQVNVDENAGDIYKLPGGRFGLSKVALDRIAQAAGISWLPELCGRVDSGSDPNIVRYKAVGRVKDLSGTWRTIVGEKEVDLVAIEDELRESVPKRDWVTRLPEARRAAAAEEAIQKEMIQFRKHRLARAQSGAMNRAIRSALALRSQYSKEELARPFVIPKLQFTPDVSDPEVKRFLLADATGNVAALYGGAALGAPALPAAPVDGPTEPAEPDAPEDNPARDVDPARAAAGGRDPSVTGPVSQNDQDEATFREAYNAEDDALRDGKPGDAAQASTVQLAVLNRMLERKARLATVPKLKKDLADFTREQRLLLFQRLYDIPDGPPESPADQAFA